MSLPENINSRTRQQLQEYLECRGFAVYDHEDTEVLREAVQLDMEEQ
jgi:hypothetical protein